MLDHGEEFTVTLGYRLLLREYARKLHILDRTDPVLVELCRIEPPGDPLGPYGERYVLCSLLLLLDPRCRLAVVGG